MHLDMIQHDVWLDMTAEMAKKGLSLQQLFKFEKRL